MEDFQDQGHTHGQHRRGVPLLLRGEHAGGRRRGEDGDAGGIPIADPLQRKRDRTGGCGHPRRPLRCEGGGLCVPAPGAPCCGGTGRPHRAARTPSRDANPHLLPEGDHFPAGEGNPRRKDLRILPRGKRPPQADDRAVAHSAELGQRHGDRADADNRGKLSGGQHPCFGIPARSGRGGQEGQRLRFPRS